jgi:DUF4097 and DUF4098 domain-containing protein YvlB
MPFTSIFMFCLITAGLRPQEPPKTAPTVPEVPYVEREERQFAFYPGGKISIEAGVPGSIKILGWEKATVRIEVEKIVYYLGPDQAKTLIAQNPMRVRHNQTSVSVRTAATPTHGATAEFNLTIYVPKDRTDISVKKSHGDFAVTSVNGWIEATVEEGSLEAESLSGYFSARTLRGDIRVKMSDNRWRGLEFAAVTQLGSVDLQLPAAYSAALQLETRDGKVTVDYPPRMVDGEPEPPEIVIRKNSQSLKASVGDGGSPIKLVTHSGDVKLSKLD